MEGDWRLVNVFCGGCLHSFFTADLPPLDEDIEDGIIVEEDADGRGTSVPVVEPNQVKNDILSMSIM